MWGSRSSAKNMCSVRTRPMPSAPFLRASAASSGLSALAHTPRRRALSAQPSRMFSSAISSASGALVATSPTNTSPVAPSMLMTSPSEITFPRAVAVPVRASKCSSSHPTTHGLPMPRVTTAAWLVMPPRLVRTASERMMPWTSSGLVSWRTSTTRSPASARSTARSGSITTMPEAAPGDAPTPWASSLPSSTAWAFASGTKRGISTCVTSSAAIRPSASLSLRTPSWTRSTAMRTAAGAVRLAVRVWRMKSTPRSTVNSMSCTSP